MSRASAELAWHQPLGRISPHHGHGGAPVLYDDNIIHFQDHAGPEGCFAAAWNRETGEQVWRVDRDADVGWSSPLVVRVGDREELIVSSAYAVTTYDPAAGAELWTASGMAMEVIPTPVVGSGLVIGASAAWRERKAIVAVQPGGSGDVSDSHVVWTENEYAPYLSSPLLLDGLFYAVDDEKAVLSCYERALCRRGSAGRGGPARRGRPDLHHRR